MSWGLAHLSYPYHHIFSTPHRDQCQQKSACGPTLFIHRTTKRGKRKATDERIQMFSILFIIICIKLILFIPVSSYVVMCVQCESYDDHPSHISERWGVSYVVKLLREEICSKQSSAARGLPRREPGTSYLPRTIPLPSQQGWDQAIVKCREISSSLATIYLILDKIFNILQLFKEKFWKCSCGSKSWNKKEFQGF